MHTETNGVVNSETEGWNQVAPLLWEEMVDRPCDVTRRFRETMCFMEDGSL